MAAGPQRFVPVDVIARSAAALPSWDIEQFDNEQRALDNAVDRDLDRWDNTVE